MTEPEQLFERTSMIGKRFADHFEILAEIGRGGMSVVYRARDILLDREVALKILNAEQGGNPNYMRRFKDEARTGSLLQHPNIIRILSYGISADNVPYLAMELSQGKTLDQIFVQTDAFDCDRFRQVFLPVLEALIYAHSQNVIHRDLKPSNIIISDWDSESPVVKVLDFGIAKVLGVEQQEDSQMTLGIAGTPFYMSPEQCKGAAADQRSDVYSLACVMYEALAKKPPFTGQTPFEVMYEHLNSSLPSLQVLSASLRIPRALVLSVFKGLSKGASERPQTMQAFREEIINALESSEIASSKPQRKTIPAVIIMLPIALILSFVFFVYFKKKTDFASLEKSKKISRLGGVESTVLQMDVARLTAEKKYDKALKVCLDAIKRNSNSKDPVRLASAYSLAGDCYYAMGKKTAAIAEYRHAVEQFPSVLSDGKLTALGKLIDAQRADGRFEESLQTKLDYIKEIEKVIGEDYSFSVGVFFASYYVDLKGLDREKEGFPYLIKALNHFDGTPTHRRRTEAVQSSFLAFDHFMKEKKPERALAELQRNYIDFVHRGRFHSSAEANLDFAKRLERYGLYTDAKSMYINAAEDSGREEPAVGKRIRSEAAQASERIDEMKKKGVKDRFKLDVD